MDLETNLQEILQQVKTRIGLLNDNEKIDTSLERLIRKAYDLIQAEGGIINPAKISHQEILSDYAVWAWESRHELDNEMPVYLRKEINNLIFTTREANS